MFSNQYSQCLLFQEAKIRNLAILLHYTKGVFFKKEHFKVRSLPAPYLLPINSLPTPSA